MTLLAEQRSPIPAPPAGQRAWQLCQDPRSCRVGGRNSVTPVSTALVNLHCCKSSKRNRKARPELRKTILAFQEATQECCPRSWRHLFTLTQLHLGDVTGTHGLAGLPTFIFFPWYLLASSLRNPERTAYSHCADEKQDLGKQQISSYFVTFQLNLILRYTLPLLFLQNLLSGILCVVVNAYLRQRCLKENSACLIRVSMLKNFNNLSSALRWFSRIKNNWFWKSKLHFN